MKKGLHFGGHIVLALAAIATFSAIVMLLWNCVATSIFRLPAINFWQALGLLVLTRLLFGGMGKPFWAIGKMHRHNPIRQKWMEMTPDERRDFIEKHHFSRHFGCDFPHENNADKHE